MTVASIEPWALRVEHVTVKRDRIVALVRVAHERYAHTTPAMIADVSALRPHLLDHACVNDKGDTFAAVACDTTLPHLLEHVAIDMQVESAGAQRAGTLFIGKTSWEHRRSLRARIEMSYANDIEALRCLKEAAELVNGLALKHA